METAFPSILEKLTTQTYQSIQRTIKKSHNLLVDRHFYLKSSCLNASVLTDGLKDWEGVL